MDPITEALILLALKESPAVIAAAIKMVNRIKAGEPTEAAIAEFVAVKHPTYQQLIDDAKAKTEAR